MPSIIGYIITGIIIGPFGLELITQTAGINQLAEIGVALLLFSIGIEISFSQFIKKFKEILLTGGFQVFITIIFGAAAALFFGLKVQEAIFIGFLLSHSSSAVILKLLQDRKETDSPHGKLSIGIIVFQDLMVVPMILLIPILGLSEKASLTDASLSLLTAAGLVALVLVVARFVAPFFLKILVNLNMRDAIISGVIVLSLGTAWVTHYFGLSFAVGAFIAGLIISETDYTHQIVSEIIPFKEIFTLLFFVSFGMLLDLQFLIKNPSIVIIYAILIMLLKITVLVSVIHILKHPMRLALMVAISLAQIGEFSFVLALEGIKYDLISGDIYKGFIAASVVTLIITPITIRLAPYIALKAPDVFRYKKSSYEQLAKLSNLNNHVVIIGYGLNGRNLARVLRETGIPYIVIELNSKIFQKAKDEGEQIIFGDATRIELLESVNVDKAKIVVFAISDPVLSQIGIKAVKNLNPNAHIIIRTRYVNEIDKLISIGADEVIPEEFETSIQIFSRVLKKFHIPNSVILTQANVIRTQSYGILRDVGFNERAFEQISQILAQGTIDSFLINERCRFINKSIKETSLRTVSGATIIAVIRNNNTITNPSADFVIEQNDQLIIFGTHNAIDKAFEFINNSLR